MGRLYSASFDDVTFNQSLEVFSIAPATNVPVAIHGFCFSTILATSVTLYTCRLSRPTGSAGSGGATATSIPLDPGYPSADAVITTNNTTPHTGPEWVWREMWFGPAPFELKYAPEDRFIVPGAGLFVISASAIGSAIVSTTISGSLYFEELG